MKIIDVKHSEIKLICPINVRGNKLDRLKYTELFLEDLKHYQIQTLPFFHQIPHDEKVTKTLELLETINDSIDLQNLKNSFHNLVLKNVHPEIQFSIESILLNKYHLKKPTYISCKINQLFSSQETFFKKLKIKIDPLFDYTNIIKLDSQLELRLDGNRQFTKEQLFAFLNKLPPEIIKRIEYIEEPCVNYFDSLEILNQFNIQLALDETLSELYLTNEIDKFPESFSYAIIKPSLIGFVNSIGLIDFFKLKNIIPVISSSYELNTGMNAHIYLSEYCNQLNEREIYHGLDTMKFIAPEFFDAKLKEDQISLFY